MMNLTTTFLLTPFLCAMTFAGDITIARPEPNNSVAWDKVWNALQSAPAPEPVPDMARQDGPPVRDGDRVLFRFRAPAGSTSVYLAGDFNGWARNDGGRITDQRFAMRPAGNGVWYQWAAVSPEVHRYKYVSVNTEGQAQWVSDPAVSATDPDGNTVLDFAAITRTPDLSASLNRRPSKPGRALKKYAPPRSGNALPTLPAQSEKTWVRPDQNNTLLVTVTPGIHKPGARLDLRITTPLGTTIYTGSRPANAGANRLPIPALKREGGFRARVTLSQQGCILGQGQSVVSVVKNVADDLRYGFYASYAKTGGDHDAKAAALARMHVNAVEFYDYFPAHGHYAPREPQYTFEPFGTRINALDIRRKIDAGHRRNILSLAYVAAYAASESIYRKYPYPMTDGRGVPKIFNGVIMAEDEADRQKKAKWFWLMNVARDSAWYRYIMGEFGRTLDDKPGDLVSFDGFEIDTYGDSADVKFYAAGSKRNGDPLRSVLRDFVGDVRSLTHKTKPHGLVSFNSVNEFAVEDMYDVTDFLFLEIWRGHNDQLEGLVDICFRHRAPRGQRVILKVYPADMNPGRTAWTQTALRRVLGAAMTGAGSLMVVGEPDEKKGEMHGLNTLYYPDHTALPSGNEAVLRAYYAHDALLLGYTHGRDVINTGFRPAVAGCITRTYAAPAKRSIVVQLLQVGEEKRWSADVPPPTPKVHHPVAIDLPAGTAPRSVYYASPDVATLHTPVKLDFQVIDGRLHTLLPDLRVYGTLLLQY